MITTPSQRTSPYQTHSGGQRLLSYHYHGDYDYDQDGDDFYYEKYGDGDHHADKEW